jgi:hypothetical protein
MNTRSAKAKGNRLQNYVAECMEKYLGIGAGDIRKTTAGVNGPDVEVTDTLVDKFPFSVECKNTERVNIWAAYEQACGNNGTTHARIPMLVIKRNRSVPLACIELETFFIILADLAASKDMVKYLQDIANEIPKVPNV